MRVAVENALNTGAEYDTSTESCCQMGKCAGWRGAAASSSTAKASRYECAAFARHHGALARGTRVAAIAAGDRPCEPRIDDGPARLGAGDEINQPLGAILRNAEAAELFIRHESPDLNEIRAILADIRKDDQRASAVINRMRALLKGHSLDAHPIEVGELVGEVAALARVDAATRHVKLETMYRSNYLVGEGRPRPSPASAAA